MKEVTKKGLDDAELSRCLYIAKAFAIISVVSAHCGNVPPEYSVLNRGASVWLGYCGTAGVPIFYLLAGYFFDQNNRTWVYFWKNKLITVIVPWILCATVLWLYVVLRKGGITLEAWARFVLGDGSTMYFVTVLLGLYIIFFYLRKYTWFMWGVTLISLCNIVKLCLGIGTGIVWYGNEYLNIVNWMGYFALGILLHKKEGVSAVINFSQRVLPITAVCYVGMCCFHFWRDISWTYWSRWALFNIALQILLCLGLSKCLCGCGRTTEYLSRCGKVSYTVFLCHQLLAGGLVYITNKWDCFFITLLRPLIVIAVWVGAIRLFHHIISKYFPGCKCVLKLIGLRDNL